MAVIRHKEAIHSGQFMVSEFEADEEDVEDISLVGTDVSAAGDTTNKDQALGGSSKSTNVDEFLSPQNISNQHDQNFKGGGGSAGQFLHPESLAPDEFLDRNERGKSVDSGRESSEYRATRYIPIEAIKKKYERYALLEVPKVQEQIDQTETNNQEQEINANFNQEGTVIQRAIQSRRSSGFATLPLIELFQSMSVAYRHKLTSPKWNRFKGLRLRWKDKIRLNNVIWRCWHLQYKKGRKKLLCAFANPLELENHKHTEAGPVVQGKYWKRKLDTIKIEYMRWRTWYHNDCKLHDKNLDSSSLEKNGSTGKVASTSTAVIERNRKMSRCISESDGRVTGGNNSTNNFDLDKAISKDDWNLEQLLFDENFLAENFPIDMQTPISLYDMDGDDYRNATNSDFTIPGLPSLQPNLFDIGVVDFDGDVMFNSTNIGAAQTIMQPGVSQSQGGKTVSPLRGLLPLAQKQFPSSSVPSHVVSQIPTTFHTMEQNVHTKMSTNSMIPHVTVVDRAQIMVSKNSEILPSDVNLQFVQGKTSDAISPVDMDNLRRQQQHESFSQSDALISPNLAAATVANMRIRIGDENTSSNGSKGRNTAYKINTNQHVASKMSQVLQHSGNSSSPMSTFENPKGALLHQSEIRALEHKHNSNLMHRSQNPPSTVSYQVVQFQEPKQESISSVMVTERGHNFKHLHSMIGVSQIAQAQSNFIRTDEGQTVSDVRGNSQDSQLVQLLRTNNKRQLSPQAFEPNKKLLLSSSPMGDNLQTNNIGSIQTRSGSIQMYSNDEVGISASVDQQRGLDEYQDVFKLPLTRQGSSGKNLSHIMHQAEARHASDMRSHDTEVSNEHVKQSQYSGQIEGPVPNSERQTYLLQRQRDVKQEEHNFLVKQEYLERQLEQQNTSSIEMRNEINCRKLTENGPRRMTTTQQPSNIVSANQLQRPPVKSEIRDASSVSSSRLMPRKYVEQFQRLNSSALNTRLPRQRKSSIPQPRASEIQQSEITSLKAVIGTTKSYSLNEVYDESNISDKELSRENMKQNLTNSFDDDKSSQRQNRRSKGSTEQHHKQKRDVHINAEQNRRTSLKTGFDGLRQIIPGLNDSDTAKTGVKISKAALLLKGGDYLKELKVKLESGDMEMAACKQAISHLKSQLERSHNSLPNGDGIVINRTSTSRPESDLMQRFFDKHVKEVTTKYNWKYWTYAQLITPLLESYNRTVRTGNMEELKRTSFAWLDQHFNYPHSRGTLTSSLTQIAIKTSILVDPEKLPEESIESAIESAPNSESRNDDPNVNVNNHSKRNVISNPPERFLEAATYSNKKSRRNMARDYNY